MSGVSNWRPKRSAAKADSRPETQDKSGSPGAQNQKPDEARFRSRVERRRKQVRLPVQELTQWEIWCTVHQIDFQDLAYDAISLYMLQFEHFENSGSPGAQPPTINDFNDLTDDETKRSVNSSSSLFPSGRPDAQEDPVDQLLAFYCEKTGNALKPRDREAFEKGNSDFPGVKELPEHAIRFGIIASILKCKTRVNSFSYCLGAIHNAAAEGISVDVTDYYLRTFDIRMAAKKNPDLNVAHVDTASEAYAEYFRNIRRAASQPTLPGAGAEMIEGEFKK